MVKSKSTISRKKPITNNITNFYEVIPDSLKKKAHNPNYANHLLELPFRALIVAPSGNFKTNLVLEILKRTSGTFEELIICCANKNQPLYEYLEKKIPTVKFYIIEDGSQIPDMDKFEKDSQKLIIFDDLIALKDQSKIVDYYIRSRHNNFSCIYLTQSYYSSNKEFKRLRLQCNYIFILKVNNQKDLIAILNEFPIGLTKSELVKFYKIATNTKTNFLLIDLINNKLRKNFLEVFKSSDERDNEIE